MSNNKFKRAYSLRIPLTQKSATFLDSSGCYNRLDEAECQTECRGQNESSGNRENSFSWEIPLITEAPKLHYCRKKWSSKSLRLPKTRQADTGSACQPQEETQMNQNIYDLNEESDKSDCNTERLSGETQSQQGEENDADKQKGKKIKHYKKTIDRAFRRGWDTFISNIYTISLARTSQDSPYLVKAC